MRVIFTKLHILMLEIVEVEQRESAEDSNFVLWYDELR